MEDTPQHVKDIQLQIWLSKPPMERLRQFLIDNDALYKFWDNAKADLIKDSDDISDTKASVNSSEK